MYNWSIIGTVFILSTLASNLDTQLTGNLIKQYSIGYCIWKEQNNTQSIYPHLIYPDWLTIFPCFSLSVCAVSEVPMQETASVCSSQTSACSWRAWSRGCCAWVWRRSSRWKTRRSSTTPIASQIRWAHHLSTDKLLPLAHLDLQRKPTLPTPIHTHTPYPCKCCTQYRPETH